LVNFWRVLCTNIQARQTFFHNKTEIFAKHNSKKKERKKERKKNNQKKKENTENINRRNNKVQNNKHNKNDVTISIKIKSLQH